MIITIPDNEPATTMDSQFGPLVRNTSIGSTMVGPKNTGRNPHPRRRPPTAQARGLSSQCHGWLQFAIEATQRLVTKAQEKDRGAKNLSAAMGDPMSLLKGWRRTMALLSEGEDTSWKVHKHGGGQYIHQQGYLECQHLEGGRQ
jgi:hypothetical protein